MALLQASVPSNADGLRSPHSPSDGSLLGARQAFELELNRAMDGEEFVLHYQPIFDLSDDMIVGVEALLRWNHPTRGLVQPDEFIGLAEETALMVPLGLWVLRHSCSQLRRWQRELGWPGWISVNISARQVTEHGLAISVRKILAAYNLPADLLRLELTETALVEAGPCAAVELQAVRNLGVHVGMDDFGTGYSSLTNLQQLPIDFLKIDRSFVSTLTRNGMPRDKGNVIVAAVAQIGRALDFETIAEGVETEEQAELLRVYHCPYAQGFHLARPASPDVIAALLVRPTQTA